MRNKGSIVSDQNESAESLLAETALLIDVQVNATVNYASYQNNVPLVRSVIITNTSSNALHDIEIIVRCEPEFAETLKLRFARLDAQEVRHIESIDLKFHHRYLAELNEAERGRVTFQVTTRAVEIAKTDRAVDVLAYDQWAGTRALPELLAAFSLPNNPVIDRLMFQGGELLSKAACGQTMNGYQSKNRDDAWAQISAIYSAVASINLNYSEPPASFGTDGQKIRTPDRVLSGGVVTCLDSTMLLASCLEQAGLNPIVLMKKGHAWAGCWLINTTFPTAVFDDGQAVRKRVASGELLVFETTMLTHRPVTSLRLACERGHEHLQQEDDFLYAIDIKRARMEQIRPLPFRGKHNSEPDRPLANAEPDVELPPAFPSLENETIILDEEERIETPDGRLARWKSKLLDLTLRNRLINFKPTKVMLPLRVPNPSHLEDELSDGKEWKFRSKPQIMQGDDPRVAAVAMRRTGEDPIEAAAVQAMQMHELLADVDAKNLDAQLYEIYSAARLGLEEGGANTLYLALGFLRWAEDERAEKTHLAPILLVPVTLTRQSVRTGYSIKRHDDETVVNPTLIQLLRENFQLSLKGLDPLPTDSSGVDVSKIWQIFRLAVKEIPRWEVTEGVYLGIFSFTKYLMWKDLQDRTEHLKKNRVVNHLIERPHEPIGGSEDIVPRDDMDERHQPDGLLTPLLADSSQLNAVSRASAGHDFALEGPPGTGKSQTITNLIAHFLGHGKTVLFVSEKMAALDVVQRRLNDIGLGPFCLQLHSSKAKKTEVLAQLRAAMNVPNGLTEDDWKREAERLGLLRANLNDLVRALHRTYPHGLTVRDATDWAIRYKHWQPAIMSWSDPDTHDRRTLEYLREMIRSIQSVVGQLGFVQHHPLDLIRHAEWSNGWEGELFNAATALDEAAAEVQKTAIALEPALGLVLSAPSQALLGAVDGLIDVLWQAPQIPMEFASQGNDAKIRTAVQHLRNHGECRQALWGTLSGLGCKPGIAQVGGDELAQLWSLASLAWWPKRWFAKRTVTGRLAAYTENQQRPLEADMTMLLDALRSLNSEDQILKDVESKAKEWLGDEYQGAQTDWAAVARYEKWGKSFEEALSRFAIANDLAADTALANRLRKLVSEQRNLLTPQGSLTVKLIAFRDAWQTFQLQLDQVAKISAAGQGLAGESFSSGLPSRVRAIIAGWHSARRWLRIWCLWRQLREQALKAGLSDLIAALEDKRVEIKDLESYAEYSYQVWWLKAITDREPVLRNFSSADHDRKIREFRQTDERFQKLTEQYIIAVLAGKVPRVQAGQRPDAEMALVQRELAKQKAHLPVRKLVQGIPTLLPKLKPCLLMSPLSVAQYLDAAHSSFDVVVFDEASQILVWDAVGAIARGKQLVVVGDPKQLPPTSFFARSDDEDDAGMDGSENGPVKDLESILDECMGAGLPTLRLEWHYRSRHESLITFSNQRYYDSRLITFPSPVTQDRAVRLEMVSGIYDRGATRTNRAEADSIVKTIAEHFSDDERRKLTMGIVTFNQTQQRLIETLLDEELRKSPELELRIVEHGSEKLFIKNLENVQGDERDLILFSIAYGKDTAGRMAMNFGPLNKEGGHRRLNVAITRARIGVTIFSSIKPEDIDLSRTRSTGVIDLKNYLEFAQKGARALVEQSLPTGREPDSPFESEVIRALRDKGWIVHPQVGCSGYRLDIGVVHPHKLGTYLMGIECDGATYHSLPTARDRDRLRQLVLEGLGWKLHRIWSTDWWTDHEREIEKLEQALNSQLAVNAA
jgi:very-short-patch-repair endonuclease